MNRIILLDIDGVLVQPGGYRAALRATVRRFTTPAFEIQEDLLTGMEQRGITSEWDMVPLILASYWDFILAQQPMPNLPSTVADAARTIQASRRADAPVPISIPAFELAEGRYPAESALRAGIFPSLPAELRRSLLSATRSIHTSETMRAFQHFTLGSRRYEETYRLPAEFETESFLLKYDRPNVDEGTCAALRRGNHLAAFTARPSRPPREVTASLPGYAPEAELALELVGLAEIPLLAFGKLEYLAARRQIQVETLLKPAPFQALAAVLAAWTEDELSALQAAEEWLESGALNGHFRALPASFELIVIEDTLSGIRSAQAAGKILRAAGFDITVRALGLTSGSASRAAMFEQARVPHWAKWEMLVDELQRAARQ
ncbi:MAG: hypothetical protein OHK0041_09280 [Anaerolineales bacterium]